jgi:hypothetical protein
LREYVNKYPLWRTFFNSANLSGYGYDTSKTEINYPYYSLTNNQNSQIRLIDTNYKCQTKTMPFLIDCECSPIIPIRQKKSGDTVFSDGTYVVDLSEETSHLDTISFLTKHNQDPAPYMPYSRQIHIERKTDSGSETVYTIVSDTHGTTTKEYKTTSSGITIVAQSAGGMGGSAQYASKYNTSSHSYSYGYINGGGGGSGASIMFMIDLNHPIDNTQTFAIDINMRNTGEITIAINSKLPSTSYPRIRLLLTPGEQGLDGLSNNIVGNGIPPGDGGQIYYFKKFSPDELYDVKDGYLITPSFPYIPESLVYYMLPAITTNIYGLIYFMCPGQKGGYGRLTYLPGYLDDPNNGTEPSIESTTLDFKPGTNTIAVPVYRIKRYRDFENCTRGEGGYSYTSQGAGGCGGYGYATVDNNVITKEVDYEYGSSTSSIPGYCFAQGSGVWISSTSPWTEISNT